VKAAAAARDGAGDLPVAALLALVTLAASHPLNLPFTAGSSGCVVSFPAP